MNTVGRLKFDDEEEEGGQKSVSRDVTEETLCQAGNAAYLVRKSVKKAKPTAKSKAKQMQKQAIKRGYAAAKRRQAATRGGQSAKATAVVVKKAAEFGRKAVKFGASHAKEIAFVIGLFLVLAFLMNFLTSCAVLIDGVGTPITMSTYPSRDEDMLAAEAQYTAMEDALQNYLDNYEATHDYDAYSFNLDDIYHDPYVLISLLTAWKPGEWTLEEVQDILQSLFEDQYLLTENVTTETRYDEDDEPYTYTSVQVTLKNVGLDHLPASYLDEDKLGMYALYMATLGNRPDLFAGSEYAGRYGENSYTDYEIPPEALSDESFAAMIAEAEKYLGFPYVWGGSNPSTSFDCSGFVCWVINHSGWDVGRTTAQGLCNICTLVRDPRPGDLVFFQGTYDSPETVTHVGIYVGNGWMIHAGDPISYIHFTENSYYMGHLYGYGRLP